MQAVYKFLSDYYQIMDQNEWSTGGQCSMSLHQIYVNAWAGSHKQLLWCILSVCLTADTIDMSTTIPLLLQNLTRTAGSCVVMFEGQTSSNQPHDVAVNQDGLMFMRVPYVYKVSVSGCSGLKLTSFTSTYVGGTCRIYFSSTSGTIYWAGQFVLGNTIFTNLPMVTPSNPARIEIDSTCAGIGFPDVSTIHYLTAQMI